MTQPGTGPSPEQPERAGTDHDPATGSAPVLEVPARSRAARRWWAIAGGGVAAVVALALVVPAVARAMSAPDPDAAALVAGYGAAPGRGYGARDAQAATGRGPWGAADTGGRGVQVDADAATADCVTCGAEPGSGDVSGLGALGADDLLTWVEEEKVALDLYTAFAGMYDARQFERVARSETSHQAAVRTLLATYGLQDPSLGAEPGEFDDPALQELYDSLLAQGSTSLADALAVGRAVELDDIDLLERTLVHVDADDVRQVLAQQLSASKRHLAAFGG